MPKVRWYEGDPSILGSPFFVMDKVVGVAALADDSPDTKSGWLFDASPDVQAAVWWNGLDQMIRVHRVDPELFTFLDRPQRGAPGFDQQLTYYVNFFTRGVEGPRALNND